MAVDLILWHYDPCVEEELAPTIGMAALGKEHDSSIETERIPESGPCGITADIKSKRCRLLRCGISREIDRVF